MKAAVIFTNADEKEDIYIDLVQSSFGVFCIGATEKGVRFIKLVSKDTPILRPNNHTDIAKSQLIAYFKKELRQFDILLDLDGYTDFTTKVWQKLSGIPYGSTISYLQLALKMGDPKCIRAAGTANGRNPVPIIIPCHRVIGSNGSLTGYALGLDMKKKLLLLESEEKYGIKQGTLI